MQGISGAVTPSTGDIAAATPAQETDFAATAGQYLDLAAQKQGLARIENLEQAAWFAARAESPDLLNQALKLYPASILTPEQMASFNAWQALALVWADTPADALKLAASSAKPSRPRPLSDYWLAQALAYRSLDDGEAATLMLVRRGAQLPVEMRPQNDQRIWDLQMESARFLFSETGSQYDATTSGWLELGRIARRFWRDDAEVDAALEQWAVNFPGHIAFELYRPLAADLARATLRSAARHIALLLPTSGRLSAAAGAIRDGFLAAHFASGSQLLDIRLYDSSDNPVSSYQQAVADGADLIVGPLDKTQVDSVIAANAGRLPVLALNYRDGSAPELGILEYGLSPEDDARSVALKALADGHTHAIALVSQDDWGNRSLSAFQQAFIAGGGTLLDSRRFVGGPRDYPATIKDLLQLEDSRSRAQALQGLLKMELDTMPVRRQDAQFLYLAATPEQGRQIRPQIRFWHASDLPIYASGRIYTGAPDPRSDRDLNGVNFCAVPWLLDSSEVWTQRRREIARAWPNRSSRLERLYAMGNDAYLLASALRNGDWMRLPVIAGATGELQVTGHRVVRTLPCARFEQGLPKPAISAAS